MTPLKEIMLEVYNHTFQRVISLCQAQGTNVCFTIFTIYNISDTEVTFHILYTETKIHFCAINKYCKCHTPQIFHISTIFKE